MAEMTEGQKAYLESERIRLEKEYNDLADTTIDAEEDVKRLRRELAAAETRAKHGNDRRRAIRELLMMLRGDEQVRSHTQTEKDA